MNEWANEIKKNKQSNISMGEWVGVLNNYLVSEWVSELLSERVSELVSEWVNEWNMGI